MGCDDVEVLDVRDDDVAAVRLVHLLVDDAEVCREHRVVELLQLRRDVCASASRSTPLVGSRKSTGNWLARSWMTLRRKEKYGLLKSRHGGFSGHLDGSSLSNSLISHIGGSTNCDPILFL